MAILNGKMIDDQNLGKFHHDLTVTEPWESWLVREIIPKWPQDSG